MAVQDVVRGSAVELDRGAGLHVDHESLLLLVGDPGDVATDGQMALQDLAGLGEGNAPLLVPVAALVERDMGPRAVRVPNY